MNKKILASIITLGLFSNMAFAQSTGNAVSSGVNNAVANVSNTAAGDASNASQQAIQKAANSTVGSANSIADLKADAFLSKVQNSNSLGENGGISTNYQDASSSTGVVGSSYSLNDLLSTNIDNSANSKDQVTELRQQALSEVAGSLGASAGLAARMRVINQDLQKNNAYLDQIFNFSRVKLDNGALAPVLVEGLSNYAQENDDEVRIADKIYKIETPAKFVSVYPTWRDYLQFTFPSVDIPPKAVLPKNAAEKAIWDEWVKKGWSEGERQADNIFDASYGRLTRDFNGMIKFKILLAQGLITKPVIAKSNMGVTGGGNQMAVNDQIFRIVDHAALVPDQSKWKYQYPVSNYQDGNTK